ncbi:MULTISPECIES: hypothetical protein [unclassified Rhizobium]|uniref:hypothetical protein n=1 Tax=unclassified Rhizobium TaxID=2613769 RepID=UPI003807339B
MMNPLIWLDERRDLPDPLPLFKLLILRMSLPQNHQAVSRDMIHHEEVGPSAGNRKFPGRIIRPR